MRLRITLATLALISASTAQAVTVTEVQPITRVFAGTAVDDLLSIRTQDYVDLTSSLAFLTSRFDTTLGTLDSVTLRFDGTFSTDTRILGFGLNRFPSRAEGDATHNVSVAIGPNTANLTTIGTEDFSTTVTCLEDNGFYNLCSDESELTREVSLDATFDALEWMAIESLPLARFYLNQGIGASLTEGRRLETFGGFDGGSITTSFSYTPLTQVPIPATGVLLIAGLGGLSLLRRRAKS